MKFFFLFYFCTLSFLCIAQDGVSSLFYSEHNNAPVNKDRKILYSIKVNPFESVIGYQSVEAEFRLNDYLGLEAGLGISFNNLRINNRRYGSYLLVKLSDSDCSSPNFAPEHDVCDAEFYEDYRIRISNIGPYLSSSLKYYPQGDALSKLYLALNAKYYRHLDEIQQVQEIERLAISAIYQDESINNYDLLFRGGWTFVNLPYSLELNLGTGLSIQNAERRDAGFDPELNHYVNATQSVTEYFLITDLGIKIGLNYSKK